MKCKYYKESDGSCTASITQWKKDESHCPNYKNTDENCSLLPKPTNYKKVAEMMAKHMAELEYSCESCPVYKSPCPMRNCAKAILDHFEKAARGKGK